MDFKLEKLIEELESHFGTLTPEAHRNAVDFYDNYDEIKTSLTQGSIRIITSSFQLSLKLKDANFEKYKTSPFYYGDA